MKFQQRKCPKATSIVFTDGLGRKIELDKPAESSYQLSHSCSHDVCTWVWR